MAASTAVPPALSTSSASWEASGWAVAAMPWLPYTALRLYGAPMGLPPPPSSAGDFAAAGAALVPLAGGVLPQACTQAVSTKIAASFPQRDP